MSKRVTEILFELKTALNTEGLQSFLKSLHDIEEGVERVEKSFKKLSKSGKKSFSKIDSAFGKLNNHFNLKGIAAGLTAGLGFKSAADFEAETYKLDVMVNTKNADEFKELLDLAMKLGAETQFSATQGLEVMKRLAASGWDVERIKAAAPVIMDLTGAASITEDNVSLSDIGSKFADLMGGFDLKAQDTKRFGDQLAYAVSNSNQGFSQLTDALQKVAATFSVAKVPYEESLALSMVLADKGIKESEAGTALSSFLAKVMQESKQIKEILLPKLSKKESESVYTKDGFVKSFVRMFELLKTKKLRPGEVSEIMGLEAGKYLLAVVNSDVLKKVQRYKKDLSSRSKDAVYNDKAKKLNAASLNGFYGQLTLFRSALEGLFIKIGNLGFVNFGTSLLKLGTDIINVLIKIDDKFLKELMDALKIISFVCAGLATFFGSIAIPIAAFKALKKVPIFCKKLFSVFNSISKFLFGFSVFLSPISLLIIAIVSALAWFNKDKLTEYLSQFDSFYDFFYDFIGKMKSVFEAVSETVSSYWDSLKIQDFVSNVGKNFVHSDIDDEFFRFRPKEEKEIRIVVEQKNQSDIPFTLSVKTDDRQSFAPLGPLGQSFSFGF